MSVQEPQDQFERDQVEDEIEESARFLDRISIV